MILSEKILYENGPFLIICRWIAGRFPERGPIQIGWSGDWETVVDCTVIKSHRIIVIGDTSK